MFESYIVKMTKLIRLVLNLSSNAIENEDGIDITKNLVELENLTELNLGLRNNNINSVGFEEILSNLEMLVNLEMIVLDLKLIDGIGWDIIEYERESFDNYAEWLNGNVLIRCDNYIYLSGVKKFVI